MSTKQRRQEEKQKRIKDIIRHAEQLLLDRGVDSFTMRELAKRSRLSIGAIYKYFPSQEDLFITIGIKWAKKLKEAISKIPQKDTGEEQIKAVVKEYIKFVKENYNFYHLINKVYNLKYKQLKETKHFFKIQKIAGETLEIFTQIIDKGIKDKTLQKDLDPFKTSVLLTMSIKYVMLELYGKDRQVLFKEEYGLKPEDLVNYCLHLLK